MTKMQKRIVEIWERIEGADPDISTERLLTMIQDETGADAGGITRAMVAAGKMVEKPNAT